jgi:hypothetical protein
LYLQEIIYGLTNHIKVDPEQSLLTTNSRSYNQRIMSFGVNINFKKKNMKNIISKIFIAFMALFMMVGCSQDFLDPNQQMLFHPDVVYF